MKILFLTPCNFADNMSGGAVCSIQNFEAICTVFGNENVKVCQINSSNSNSRIGKISQYFKKLILKSSTTNLNEIINRSESCDLIFIDTSKYGDIARLLRKIKYEKKIVTFFHNCEYIYISNEYKNRNIILKLISLRWTYYAENCALQYSDKTICLNTRDKIDIFKIYKKSIDFIIPIYMNDRVVKQNTLDNSRNDKLTLLFIGSAFHANISGIVWFLKNIMPHVNIQLLIVGKGMGILKNHETNTNVEIYDSVHDLSEFYVRADSMLFPIFEGSGMKVKTCEALMYGKYIIGTKEAFEGYDLDYSKIGACCNTAKEFIDQIKMLEKKIHTMQKLNFYARNTYETKFSPKVNITLLKKALTV